jgi:hypothetical protein
MSEERQDPKQVAAFRALARRLTEPRSMQRFEEALQKLVTPSPDEEPQPLVDKEAKARQKTAKR